MRRRKKKDGEEEIRIDGIEKDTRIGEEGGRVGEKRGEGDRRMLGEVGREEGGGGEWLEVRGRVRMRIEEKEKDFVRKRLVGYVYG